MFGGQIFERQRIGNLSRVKSLALISDDNKDPLATVATAADVNQLPAIQAIAMHHGVTQSFPKREFNKLLLAADTVRRRDQVHKPVHQRGDQGNLASHPRVHIQGSTSETGFAEHRLQRLEATNPNHFRNLLSGLTIRPLARGAGTSRPDFAREENQRRSDQAGAAQQPETVEKTKKCRLLMNDSRYLRFGVQSSIRGGETARQKVSRQSSQRFPKALVERCGVRNQHGLISARSFVELTLSEATRIGARKPHSLCGVKGGSPVGHRAGLVPVMSASR